MLGQFGVRARKDAVVETFHAFCAEWRIERAHLIDNTTEGPNVTLLVIGLLLPDLRTGIVWGSRLGVQHAILRYFTHVQIPHLKCAIRALENVRRLQVPMEYVAVMKSF